MVQASSSPARPLGTALSKSLQLKVATLNKNIVKWFYYSKKLIKNLYLHSLSFWLKLNIVRIFLANPVVVIC